MKSVYEAIRYSEDLPIKMFIHSVQYVQNHWHESLEILLVLEGEVTVVSKKGDKTLVKGDIIVLPPSEIHNLNGAKNNILLALQISKEFVFAHLGNNFTENPEVSENGKNTLRSLIAHMALENSKKMNFYEIKLQSLLFDMIHTLGTHFVQVTDELDASSQKHRQRINSLLSFIQQNFKDDLSLQTLAENEFLSVSYVSRFFTNQIGVSFKDYLSSLRLSYAVKQLIDTDKNILDIALESGFPNVKSLTAEFKKLHSSTINNFRKQYKTLNTVLPDGERSSNYTEIRKTDIFRVLFEFLDNKPMLDNAQIEILKQKAIDVGAKTSILHHYWKEMVGASRAKDILRSDVREQLQLIQKDIGFKSLRFHGLFDSEMMIYNVNEHGEVYFNFHYVDNVFDFLLRVGLKPFIEIGFMPRALALNKKPYFSSPVFASPPNNMDVWCDMLKSFYFHMIDRYGSDTVFLWQSEFWNEPEILGVFWNGTNEEFFEFYHASYCAIKSVSQKLKIGGPAISKSKDMQEYLDSYFSYCEKNACKPDFVTFHFYPHDDSIDDITSVLMQGKHSPVISENENFLSDVLADTLLYFKSKGYEKSDIYITEFNSAAPHRELTHDTLFKACYIIKNVCENFSKVQAMSYWAVSDIIEELPLPTETFHGGIGLLTQEGIKKPSYYAYKLLNLLCDNLVERGNGFIVTKSENKTVVLLYNYCHYNKLYCDNDRSLITTTDRYTVFRESRKKFSIKLASMKFGSVSKHMLSRQHGSTFDQYIQMGSKPHLSFLDIEYLNSTVPSYSYRQSQGDSYEIKDTLRPHEIVVYVFE